MVKRVDPFSKSHDAHMMAQTMDDDAEAATFAQECDKETAKRLLEDETRGTKRGVCVGEAYADADDADARDGHGRRDATHKRGRMSKKNTKDGKINTLKFEAEQVLIKLVDYDRAASFKKRRTDNRIERKRLPPDLRMCDEAFVFSASVRKYVKG